MDALSIDRAALDAILAHARETHPEECCGAIVARDGVDVVHRFTNIQSRLHAEDPENNPRDGTRGYTPEPKELLAALHAGEEPGARLVAFYHSHPITGSYFSGEDRARAMFGDEPAYPDVTYVVVSDARTAGETRAFHWDDASQDFVERELQVRGAPPAEPERAAAPAAEPVVQAKRGPAPAGRAQKPAAKAARKAVRKRAAAAPGAARPASGKATRKRPAGTTGKKTPTRSAAGKKPAGKRTPPRNATRRKTAAARTGATKKAAARKAAARKAATKKAAAGRKVHVRAAPRKTRAAARARTKKK